jgi:hypothetical protein
MERKIYWTVALVSVAILVGTFFMTGEPTEKNDLPWHIEHPTPDTVSIFGLTLGQSNTNQAEQRFKEDAKPSLFKSPKGELVAEVFFEQVELAGLRSRIVLTIAVPEEELKAMYERGLRMSGTSSGKKITLTPEDEARLRTLPIAGLTYMPGIRLDEAVLLKRFGQPAQRVKEKESGAIHWLYPQNGLDLTLGGDEKPLMQYVTPRDFARLTHPLLDSGEVLTQ